MDNEWIEHDGGLCPVDLSAVVDTKFFDGRETMRWPADECIWTWNTLVFSEDHIIAYRVVQS